MNTTNPPFVFSYHKLPNNDKEVIVVRDDQIMGGTKTRGLPSYLLSDDNIREYVFVGPSFSLTQVSLAISAQSCGKFITCFIPKKKYQSDATIMAKKLNARIREVDSKSLQDVQDEAELYIEEQNKKHGENSTEIVPFGLNCSEFIEGLAKSIQLLWPKNIQPKRIWLACGSGTILQALKLIFPQAQYMLIEVGLEIPKKSLKNIFFEIFKAPEQFWLPAEHLPPFPSVKTYDAKIWQFVLQHAEDGDLIWNCGQDIEQQTTIHNKGQKRKFE